MTTTPTDGHGYTGDFTAKEFFERAFDHDKAARNGLSAGPNVSFVRTFQACAAALRYAANHMFAKPDDNNIPQQISNPEWNKAGRVHDWRNHVSVKIRAMWNTFTDDQKIALAADAEDRANLEEWE